MRRKGVPGPQAAREKIVMRRTRAPWQPRVVRETIVMRRKSAPWQPPPPARIP
ncbi:MAG: hypothetical protein ACRD1U_08500 [Vicinamibacterales bacterium]